MRWLLISLLFTSCTFLSAKVPTFQKLTKDERVEVTFSSSGCFHHSTELFIFQGNAVEVFQLSTTWSQEKQEAVEESRTRLGKLELSPDDLKKLDKLFKFYAKPGFGGCTTVDTIQVKHYKEKDLLSADEFTDGTCSTYGMKSLLTFGELERRLAEDDPISTRGYRIYQWTKFKNLKAESPKTLDPFSKETQESVWAPTANTLEGHVAHALDVKITKENRKFVFYDGEMLYARISEAEHQELQAALETEGSAVSEEKEFEIQESLKQRLESL